jgi:hypothetical protein
LVTEEQIKELYADWNDQEAADELQPAVLRATAHYANMCELLLDGTENDQTAIATALDVLRLAEGGEFDLVHPDGNHVFEYCSAAEQHVAANPTHKATVRYETHEGHVSMLVECWTEHDPENVEAPHWWDHVA